MISEEGWWQKGLWATYAASRSLLSWLLFHLHCLFLHLPLPLLSLCLFHTGRVTPQTTSLGRASLQGCPKERKAKPRSVNLSPRLNISRLASSLLMGQLTLLATQSANRSGVYPGLCLVWSEQPQCWRGTMLLWNNRFVHYEDLSL